MKLIEFVKKEVISGGLLLACTLPTVALAEDPPRCPDYRTFEIYIQNHTKSQCTIIQQHLRRGYLQKTFFPTHVLPNEKKQVFTIEDYTFQGSDLVLTYDCGHNKMVTVESERDIWAGDDVYVKGWIWSVAGMNASYDIMHLGSCDENKPAKIVWTLSED